MPDSQQRKKYNCDIILFVATGMIIKHVSIACIDMEENTSEIKSLQDLISLWACEVYKCSTINQWIKAWIKAMAWC